MSTVNLEIKKYTNFANKTIYTVYIPMYFYQVTDSTLYI